MKTESHIIRKAQYVTRYGPGSIIETKNESRLILSMKLGYNFEFTTEKLKKYEISEPRLTALLKKKKDDHIGILNVPTNESENLGAMDILYRTKRFPHWYICHNNHKWANKSLKSVLFHPNKEENYKCPICKNDMKNCSSVRFILACPNGHLDDVHWNIAVHQNSYCQRSKNEVEFYEWSSYGTNIEQIIIKCPYCKDVKRSMLEIYFTEFNCSGLYQESFNGNINPNRCEKPMKIIQKSSSSLRLPNNISFLSLPEFFKNLGGIARKNNDFVYLLESSLKSLSGLPKTSAKLFLENLCNNNTFLTEEEKKYILTNNADDLLSEISDILYSDKLFIDYIYEEFETLNGAEKKTDIFDKSNFSTIHHQVPKLPPLKICRLNLIRSITVQTSYKRIPYTKDRKNKLIKIQSKDIGENLDSGNKKWYPGFESYGEGLYITFDDVIKVDEIQFFYENYQSFINHLIDEENMVCKKWSDHKYELSDMDFNDWSDYVPHPLFVWLHTLSHALIKQIAVYAGYNVASIKERIYLNRDKTMGGILIYNTSVGTDGGMGGLTELTRYFEKILKKAYDSIHSCSNDPLCIKKEKTEMKTVGSCCHSCLLISETSCEHQNRWLDRNIILE